MVQMYALYLPGDCPKLVPEPREKNRKKKVKQGEKTNARLAPPGDCPKLVSEQEKEKTDKKKNKGGKKRLSLERRLTETSAQTTRENIYFVLTKKK